MLPKLVAGTTILRIRQAGQSAFQCMVQILLGCPSRRVLYRVSNVPLREHVTINCRANATISEWLLSLRLVCNAWNPVVESFVMRDLYFEDSDQLSKLNQGMSCKQGLQGIAVRTSLRFGLSRPPCILEFKQRPRLAEFITDKAHLNLDDSRGYLTRYYDAKVKSRTFGAHTRGRAGSEYYSEEQAGTFLAKAKLLNHFNLMWCTARPLS